jgi:type I restriction enzyme R subunit
MSSVNGIFTEAMLEEAAIEILQSLDYDYAFGPDISLGGDYEEVILSHRVKDALFKINRDLPREALEDAYRQLITFNSPMLEENNRYFHQLMTEGIEVSFNEGGHIRTKRAYIIDFKNMSNNEFVVVNQFTT